MTNGHSLNRPRALSGSASPLRAVASPRRSRRGTRRRALDVQPRDLRRLALGQLVDEQAEVAVDVVVLDVADTAPEPLHKLWVRERDRVVVGESLGWHPAPLVVGSARLSQRIAALPSEASWLPQVCRRAGLDGRQERRWRVSLGRKPFAAAAVETTRTS